MASRLKPIKTQKALDGLMGILMCYKFSFVYIKQNKIFF